MRLIDYLANQNEVLKGSVAALQFRVDRLESEKKKLERDLADANGKGVSYLRAWIEAEATIDILPGWARGFLEDIRRTRKCTDERKRANEKA